MVAEVAWAAIVAFNCQKFEMSKKIHSTEELVPTVWDWYLKSWENEVLTIFYKPPSANAEGTEKNENTLAIIPTVATPTLFGREHAFLCHNRQTLTK